MNRRFALRRAPVMVLAAVLLGAVLAVPAFAAEPFRFPTASVLGVATNCGVTNIIGFFEDANGNPVDGIAARIRSLDGSYNALSDLSTGGAWRIVLGPSAIQGDWQVWADVLGVQQSPVINIRTDGPPLCGPERPGVQTVWVKIGGVPSTAPGQGAVPGVPQPQPTPPPAPPSPTNGTPFPDGPTVYPTARVDSTLTTCNGTGFYGRVLDANGNGVPGAVVRVMTDEVNWWAASNPADGAGNWSLGLFPTAERGGWQLWVQGPGDTRASPTVRVVTDGADKCNPGTGGVQQATLTFQR